MSADPGREEPLLLRIEKGSPDAAELAAVTTALFTRLTAPPPESGHPGRTAASWRRPERSSGFEGPRSWQDTLS
ncbi:acyl-CoA carboxylase subunit epsilon [Streptomyces sp. C11-1]|uniref:Acyl-CoA carboxylase subunit epsilon n=1 Tax=Streptomyces durocortorensis TaxID=2811104 RepID=A0ABY9W466_9ACTN|nr:acyl-CoA carboxylase subunit epsilon [Streptomyces durocortorensis]WNF30949.1 acyl-CoA carboxylase subunit epsilon [Streptomyces durocortorensis]